MIERLWVWWRRFEGEGRKCANWGKIWRNDLRIRNTWRWGRGRRAIRRIIGDCNSRRFSLVDKCCDYAVWSGARSWLTICMIEFMVESFDDLRRRMRRRDAIVEGNRFRGSDVWSLDAFHYAVDALVTILLCRRTILLMILQVGTASRAIAETRTISFCWSVTDISHPIYRLAIESWVFAVLLFCSGKCCGLRYGGLAGLKIPLTWLDSYVRLAYGFIIYADAPHFLEYIKMTLLLVFPSWSLALLYCEVAYQASNCQVSISIYISKFISQM